jgi:hypothetical protein
MTSSFPQKSEREREKYRRKEEGEAAEAARFNLEVAAEMEVRETQRVLLSESWLLLP